MPVESKKNFHYKPFNFCKSSVVRGHTSFQQYEIFQWIENIIITDRIFNLQTSPGYPVCGVNDFLTEFVYEIWNIIITNQI